MTDAPTRRRLTTLDKLKIVVNQARCPLCNERLGDLAGLQFDHTHALGRGGADDIENQRAIHVACHRVKTSGTKATTLGSDIHEIAKTRRMGREEEDFRRRLLAKAPGEPRERKSRIKSRGFDKRR